MAENKQYITQDQENGAVMISEDVIAVITAAAATEVEGVAGLYGAGKELTELLGIKNQTRGVHIQLTEQSVRVDLSISVKYGFTVVEVAKAVQDAVYTNIESMTGLKAECVNVNVGGVAFEQLVSLDSISRQVNQRIATIDYF